MQAGPVISLSPSFNSYSDGKLAGIAARVADEFDSDEFHDEFGFERRENPADQREPGGISNSRNPESDADDDDFDFNFAFVTRDSESSPQISADEIFQNGKIRPVYPVFNSDLLLGHVKFQNENEKENDNRNSNSEGPRIRHPLRNLFIEERETTMTTPSSSSSSEADEMDGAAAEEGRRKKSSSTGGSSKSWKLKNLLRRSHSYGSKDCVFLTHSNSSRKKEQDEKKAKKTLVGGGKVTPAPPSPCNRDGGEKLRSYLPYRLDLVGIFGNLNGLKKI